MQHSNRSTGARRFLAILAATAALACGDDDSPNVVLNPLGQAPVASSNATIIVSGNAQTVARGQVSTPLVVRVDHPMGGVVANTAVTWTIANGGTLSATSTTTNANGEAQVTVTAGSTTKAYTITATAAAATPATFFVYVP